jgi:predicted unusual protein kinase regulating ubiquinone biosynthesis (AarF/ABC1/UbiB family)
LKALHADPHPGNFIITKDYKLGIIDFGCVKVIPESFHKTYFQLQDEDVLSNVKKRDKVFKALRFVYEDDKPKDKEFFTKVFSHLVELLSRPFRHDIFDFSDEQYFKEMYSFGEELSNMKELRESKKARGVRDSLYINRTYFGLYNLLHDLKAEIKVRN